MKNPDSVPLFGSITDFETAFPKIQDATLTGEIFDGWWPIKDGSGSVHLSKQEMQEILPCVNPACRHGGFKIGYHLHEMHEKNIAEKAINEVCHGEEGSSKGRQKGRSCGFVLKGTIRITFKP